MRSASLRTFHAGTFFLCALAAFAPPARAQVKLDVPEAEIRAAKPGHILRVHPQIGGALNAKAYRVIYRSTGLNGQPIAVSGTIIFPVGPAPKRGRDIVAWAHYTTGVAERCAPTLLPILAAPSPGSSRC
jgi:hypothetical protein